MRLPERLARFMRKSLPDQWAAIKATLYGVFGAYADTVERGPPQVS